MDATRRFRTVEEKRDALLDELAALDPALLSARPPSGGWSILEVVEHMVLSEEDVLGDLDRLGERTERRRRLRNRLLFYVVLGVLRFRIPVKVPSTGMEPRGGSDLPALRERWERNHDRIRGFLAGLGAKGGSRALFRHPVSGSLTVTEALRLLDAHVDRHTGQIAAIRDALGAG